MPRPFKIPEPRTIKEPERLDASTVPVSAKNELIKRIHEDVRRYNLLLPTAINLRRANPTDMVDSRIVGLLDSIFKNAMAYMLLKPFEARGDKGSARTRGLIAMIKQIEAHAQYHGIKFLVSAFEKRDPATGKELMNYGLERADQSLFGMETFHHFMNWAYSKETTDFKDKYADPESTLVYLTEAARRQYEVHFDGHLIRDVDDNLITTTKKTEAAYSGMPADLYVCSAKTQKIYSRPGVQGELHHSSFLAGEPVIAAGDWVIENGVLKFISGASGHYRPTIGNMQMFVSRYGASLHPEAWIQPYFKGPVYKVKDYRLRGEAARPDPQGVAYAKSFQTR